MLTHLLKCDVTGQSNLKEDIFFLKKGKNYDQIIIENIKIKNYFQFPLNYV